MRSYEDVVQLAFEMSGMDGQTWSCIDESERLYWKLLAAKMPERRFALVRMELIGEPTISPDGQSIQLARFPWQRPTDGSHGISLNDIVGEDNGPRRDCRCSVPKAKAI